MGQTTDIGGRGEIGFAGIMVALERPEPLRWLSGTSVLEKAKGNCTVLSHSKKLDTLSACHAGRLGDHRTPVGSVDL